MLHSTSVVRSRSMGRALGLALASGAGLWLALAIVISAAHAAPAAPPPTFVVNDSSDAVAAGPLDDGVCSTTPKPYPPVPTCTLRAAIMKANHYPGGGVTITFDPAFAFEIVELSISPQGADGETTGDLNISQTTHINGLVGGGPTIIDAHASGDRIFHLAPGAVVDMFDMVLQNGTAGPASQGGGAVLVDSGAALSLDEVDVTGSTDNSGLGGGGIRNRGTLTSTLSGVSGNVSSGPGGGLANDGGVATLAHDVVFVNRSAYWGGGLYNNGPRLTIADTSVDSNTAVNYGGGLAAASGQTTVTASTFYSNFTGLDGGAVEGFATGHVNVINSTLSANDAAGYGGGLEANQSGVVSLYNATVSDNIADYFLAGNGQGGGLSIGGSGVVNLQNSIVAGNQASASPFGLLIRWPDECFSAINSNGYNLFQYVPSNCTIGGLTLTNQINVDPLLGPLQFNGTARLKTQALLPGSPAIDAADPTGCKGPDGARLATDERGLPRTANITGVSRCDIGAFEVQRLLFLPLARR